MEKMMILQTNTNLNSQLLACLLTGIGALAIDEIPVRTLILFLVALLGAIIGIQSNYRTIIKKEPGKGIPIACLALILTFTGAWVLPDLLAACCVKDNEFGVKLAIFFVPFFSTITFAVSKYWITNQDQHGTKIIDWIMQKFFPKKISRKDSGE